MGANDRELNDPFLPPENEYHEWLLALEQDLASREGEGLSSRTLSPAEIASMMSRRTSIESAGASERQREFGFQDEPKKEQEKSQ